MAGFIPKHDYMGCHHISEETDITCTNIDQYYKISGNWTDGYGCNNGFIFDGNGKITFNGMSGTRFLLNGVSDVKSNKLCEIYYTLYKNGIIVPNFYTPITYEHANSFRNISITNILKLNKYDYLEIFIKSDTANTILTIATLQITSNGDR